MPGMEHAMEVEIVRTFTAGPHNFTFTPSSSNPVLRLKTRSFQSEIARFRFCSKLHMVPPGEATANPYQYRHAGTQDENFGKSEAAFRFYFFASQAPQLVRPGVSGLQRVHSLYAVHSIHCLGARQRFPASPDLSKLPGIPRGCQEM